MTLSWSRRRKLLYTAVFGVLMLVVFFITYQTAFNQAPTCFDGKQNQDEHGVDCGGSICTLLCTNEARSPVVLWSRAFQTGQQTYTAAAYIQNPNLGAGARQVGYTFQLFDAKNSLVVEQRGKVDIPPVQTIPIVLPNINVGFRTPTKAIFAFTTTPVWQRQEQLPILHVGNQFLSNDASVLSATLLNDSSTDAKNSTVTAILLTPKEWRAPQAKALSPPSFGAARRM